MKLSISELVGMLESTPALTLVDVRSPVEYDEDGHIAGARNIPLAGLLDAQDQLRDAEVIVCMCAAGARSACAATLLRAHGFAAVYDVSGGYAAWSAAGLPLVQLV
jgi:rhodanese-related sulfurtransferase